MTPDRDQWWLRQVRRLIESEMSGVNPATLEKRWLMLDLRANGKTRWTISFTPPEIINHLLDDFDIRARDAAYALWQREQALEWLNA